ncbi:hypothetical protein ScPMuIL_015317 [Solemya velum]
MAAPATTAQAHEIIDDEALAEEKLWEELENEEIPASIRESRLEALRQQSVQFRAMKEKDYGKYTTLEDEKVFLDTTTSEGRCVVHFYHQDFRRCAILDTHFETLSQKYFETKFAKINVEVAKFLVERLKIRILPAVLCFKDGIVVDRIIGFDELGNTDDFQTEVLERRLGFSGVIDIPEEEKTKKTIFGFKKCNEDDDDSDSD